MLSNSFLPLIPNFLIMRSKEWYYPDTLQTIGAPEGFLKWMGKRYF